MDQHTGIVLATHTLTARNTATASSNRMHDDSVARRLGFAGGLVPGADVWAYVAHALVETWGLDWLAEGAMELRFHAPFYEGDRVCVHVTAGDDQNTVRLAAVNDSGTLCAGGTATRSVTTPPPDPAGIPAAPLPTWPPPRASAAHFESHPVLGTLEAPWSEDLAATYLDAVGEQSPLLRDGAVAPPGWLARLTDFVLVANVTMGPWIFAQAQLRHLGLVHAGETVAVRARVAQLYDRSGHRFVDLDLLMLTGAGRPVVCGRKTAIYEPRGA